MLPKVQKFFTELQQSDNETKKRWLVILTSGTMVLIVGLWIVYLNLTIQTLNPKEEIAGPNQFWETIKIGLSAVTANLKDLLKKSNSVTIQGEDFKPVIPSLDEIKPKQLP